MAQAGEGISAERRIAAIFAEVLDRPAVEPDEDFFAIGGDSIQAVSVVLQIEEVLGAKIPLAAMAEAATARALAALIAGSKPKPVTYPAVVVPFRSTGSRPPLFFIHGGAGQVLNFRRLAEVLGDDIPVYGLKTVYDDMAARRMVLSMEEQSAIFARAIIEVQPHGPYCLGGYSFGGIAAYETAFRLLERGEQVALIAMVDADVAEAGAIVDYGDYAAHVIARQEANEAARPGRADPLQRGAASARHAGRLVANKLRQRVMRLSYPYIHRSGRAAPEWLFSVLRANQFAETAYAPRPSMLPIRFFRVGQGRVKGGRVNGRAPDELGWTRVAPNRLVVHDVPGDHYLAMSDPTVGEIARQIGDHIRAIALSPSDRIESGSSEPAPPVPVSRSALHVDLAWLPRPPADFRSRCAALEQSTGPFGTALRQLASHAMNMADAAALAAILRQLKDRGSDLAPLATLRLALLSNATTSYIAPMLAAAALRHGVALDVAEMPFGQAAQLAFDPGSALYAAKPDVVLLALDHRGLPLRRALDESQPADSAGAEASAYLANIRRAIRDTCGATCIVQTVARPPEPLFGSFDAQAAGTVNARISAFNRAVIADLAGSEDKLLDVAALAETVGLATWHEPRQWMMARLPFAQALVPLYADHVARLLGAMRGKSRRVLVLDLDNTLWGGVIGDDGLDGIVLGEGDADGEAHLALQEAALALRERGVLLAVCSKNDDVIARSAFRSHPEMRLKEDDIVVFQANWNDKADNLRAIAAELSLDLDSFAFVDDNPAERQRIREALPEVAVIELGGDPAQHARLVLASGYFEAVAFSAEDRARAGFYQANARRAALAVGASDLTSYLRSLEMTITFAPFDDVGRARIAQLINKSNQFNLTTRRYSEAEIAALQASPAHFTLQVRLVDRFGDNGMISVVICKQDGARWEIDAWLMSCRVLGRRVEEAVLQEIVARARAAAAAELVGRYAPTERNGLVKDHYAKLGFRPAAAESGAQAEARGESVWSLDLAAFRPTELPLIVRRERTAAAASVA